MFAECSFSVLRLPHLRVWYAPVDFLNFVFQIIEALCVCFKLVAGIKRCGFSECICLEGWKHAMDEIVVMDSEVYELIQNIYAHCLLIQIVLVHYRHYPLDTISFPSIFGVVSDLLRRK